MVALTLLRTGDLERGQQFLSEYHDRALAAVVSGLQDHDSRDDLAAVHAIREGETDAVRLLREPFPDG